MPFQCCYSMFIHKLLLFEVLGFWVYATQMIELLHREALQFSILHTNDQTTMFKVNKLKNV